MVSQRNLYLTLMAATIAAAWSSIIIRLTDAGPMANSFYRMLIASAILAIPALPKVVKIWPQLGRQQILLLMLSGLALALHFATWISSLYFTTVSNSVILVSTTPVFLMIMESLILKEKVGIKAVVGMMIALAGIVIISGGDPDLGIESLKGDFLALAGALFAAIYLLIGRKVRVKLNNLEYVFIVYSCASLFLLIIALFDGTNLTDFNGSTWMLFFLLALVPTIIGHSLYNWVLKYIPAYRVATVILGEPIGATILALIFFSEQPGWATIFGGVLVLIGIYLVMRRPAAKAVSPNT